MGIIDSFKKLLGLGETFDTNRDGTFGTHDPKSTRSGFADTNNHDSLNISDIQDPPPAVSKPNDATNGNVDPPKE
jgi:hypothetical protein